MAAQDAINGESATLYAAGFNAHNQLQEDSTKDLHTFAPIYSSEAKDLRVVFLSWSSTILMSGSRVFSRGFQQLDHTFPDPDTRLHSAVGDHNGMKACLDQSGRLYIVEGISGSMQSLLCHDDESYSIKLLAYAQNGRVAMVLDEQSCVYEFESFEKFDEWLYEGISARHTVHELPGPAEQLLGGSATFVLSTGSEIFTWGDGRFQSLGRPVSTAQPPAKPSFLEDLRGAEGARWEKIAANGWMSAALGENNALYVWGANPSIEGSINAIQPEEASLVELPTLEGEEPLDVLDMGLGTNHLVILAKDGPKRRLFVTGANRNGQLGLQAEKKFEEDWQEVENVPSSVKAVFCGPNSTFLLT